MLLFLNFFNIFKASSLLPFTADCVLETGLKSFFLKFLKFVSANSNSFKFTKSNLFLIANSTICSISNFFPGIAGISIPTFQLCFAASLIDFSISSLFLIEENENESHLVLHYKAFPVLH